jgi:hypothetical protein
MMRAGNRRVIAPQDGKGAELLLWEFRE